MSFFGSRSRSVSGEISSLSKSFSQSSSSDVEGFFLQARGLAQVKKDMQGLFDKSLLDAGIMGFDDRAHRFGIGEANVVKEAAPEKGVGQLLLVVRRDDDDRPAGRAHRLSGFVDEEFHPVEFEQEVVGKFDVRLVDLVNQQDWALGGDEGLPEFAALDVMANVRDARVAQLRIAQARDRVILIEALLRLGRRFDMPGEQGAPSAPAISSASSVLPVPGSPLMSSGRSRTMAAFTAILRSSVAI